VVPSGDGSVGGGGNGVGEVSGAGEEGAVGEGVGALGDGAGVTTGDGETWTTGGPGVATGAMGPLPKGGWPGPENGGGSPGPGICATSRPARVTGTMFGRTRSPHSASFIGAAFFSRKRMASTARLRGIGPGGPTSKPRRRKVAT
jgi:hypothetical protein